MRRFFRTALDILAAFLILVILHAPLLKLPYFWDEAGYYIPAALDFYRHGYLIPRATLPTGHTPLVIVYLGAAWHLLGFSSRVTRATMILVAASALVALHRLARWVAPESRELALWSVALLALCPLFFAQSSLAHLDLAAALWTTAAVLALLEQRPAAFALAAGLAVLAKETAVVLLPAAWLFAARRARERRFTAWILLALPVLPLLAWSAYYHSVTGYWTGNAQYLQYNLYSTLNPGRILLSLARRLYQVFAGGFHWLLTAAAILGWRAARKPERSAAGAEHRSALGDFYFLTAALAVAYLALLSAVGGAVLPRYLLPVFPVLYLSAALLVWNLPRRRARTGLAAVALGFVGSWFLNPPYPFPFEDNLAYADFIRLHQQAAWFLEHRAPPGRILTAWPASDELREPTLGYVGRPLAVVCVEGFAARDLAPVAADSFDLVYFYSRHWQPPDGWLGRFPALADLERRYFDYAPEVSAPDLEARYRLRLLAHFERRGQWVRIYAAGGGRIPALSGAAGLRPIPLRLRFEHQTMSGPSADGGPAKQHR